MLARVFALVLLASSAVLATSYSFRTQPTGRLGGPVRFEFRAESTAGAKRDVTSLTVSKRTLDHTWKPVWSISGKALGTIATCLAILAFVAAITDKTANVSGNDWVKGAVTLLFAMFVAGNVDGLVKFARRLKEASVALRECLAKNGGESGEAIVSRLDFRLTVLAAIVGHIFGDSIVIASIWLYLNPK